MTILIPVDMAQTLTSAAPPVAVRLWRPLAALAMWLFTLALALPVLALAASWLQLDAEAWDVLRQMADTVLPEYVQTSLWLCLAVAVAVAAVGMATASAVTLFDFPGRRVAEWALLLPLAMPAYVVAYAYTLKYLYISLLKPFLSVSTSSPSQVQDSVLVSKL